MSKSYKVEHSTGTPEDLITMAVDELTALGEELSEWHASISDTNLGNSEKAIAIGEAADALSNLSEPNVDDWPNASARIPYTEQVPRRKRRQPSRQVRFDNAVAKIQAVIDFYNELDEDHSELTTDLEAILDDHEMTIPGAF